MNLQLLSLLEGVLGKGKKTSKDNVAFNCPICHHHKRKMEIDMTSYFVHCWVCGYKTRKLISLFRKIRVDDYKIKKLYALIGEEPQRESTYIDTSKPEIVRLPNEFIPLWKDNKSPEYRNALFYLKSRNITHNDILKYRIGYCETGEYAKKVIIPSFDASGNLNYFTGRAYYDSETFKHKNPAVSKNVIGFELFINWNLPIVIVEGAFDAMAIKRNAIPLFGKIVLDKLKLKLIEKKVKEVYIALDKDALKDALLTAEYLMNNNIKVYLVELSDKDPSQIGFQKMVSLLKETEPMTLHNLIEQKLFS
jgi:DNA primase